MSAPDGGIAMTAFGWVTVQRYQGSDFLVLCDEWRRVPHDTSIKMKSMDEFAKKQAYTDLIPIIQEMVETVRRG